jgi:hypothetical protein
MQANRQFFVENYEKLVSPIANQFVGSLSSNEKSIAIFEVRTNRLVGHFMPVHEILTITGRADEDHPLVSWLMNNSLVSPSEYQKLIEGGTLGHEYIESSFMEYWKSQDDARIVQELYWDQETNQEALRQIVANVDQVVNDDAVAVRYNENNSREDLLDLLKKTYNEN